jgi:hypothetical protein
MDDTPTSEEVHDLESQFRQLVGREYPEGPDETLDSAFSMGMRDGFSLAFQGLLREAFPRADRRRR